MTDASTIGAVERLIERLMLNTPVITQDHMDAATEIMPQAASMLLALRERAEAAERAHLSLCEAIGIPATALSHIEYTAQLTAARRAEAAAWNDAIEAVAKRCDKIAGNTADFGRDYRRAAGHCATEARALRRAAPTEGEA